jgi:hypothetical protein
MLRTGFELYSWMLPPSQSIRMIFALEWAGLGSVVSHGAIWRREVRSGDVVMLDVLSQDAFRRVIEHPPRGKLLRL